MYFECFNKTQEWIILNPLPFHLLPLQELNQTNGYPAVYNRLIKTSAFKFAPHKWIVPWHLKFKPPEFNWRTICRPGVFKSPWTSNLNQPHCCSSSLFKLNSSSSFSTSQSKTQKIRDHRVVWHSIWEHFPSFNSELLFLLQTDSKQKTQWMDEEELQSEKTNMIRWQTAQK